MAGKLATQASRGMLLGVIALVALAAGCSAPTPVATVATVAPTASATSGPDYTATAVAVQAAGAIALTFEAAFATGTAHANAGALATQAAATEAVVVGRTATAEQRLTEAAERKVTRTAAAAATLARATAVAQPLQARVAQMVAEGYLKHSDGEYARLDDYSEAWAQINWYQWLWTGYAPTDFVVRADFSWESASNTANWFDSGCGFVFREASRENLDHYLVHLGLDGVVYFYKARGGVGTELASARAEKLDLPNGSAQFMLAVEGDKFTAYVNNRRVITAHDGSLKTGLLNYTLLSGTNRDFGTRCTMENVELWTLAAP